MPSPGMRTAVVAVVAVLVVPLLLLHTYLLAWYLPELTDPGAGRRPYHWVLVAVLTCASAAGLLVAWLCRHRSRWWLWPLVAAGLALISWPLVYRLP